MKKLILVFVASLIYLIFLFVVYFIHVNYLRVDVVFYAAIQDGILASILAGGFLLWFKFFNPLSGFEKLLIFVIWLLGSYAFAISIPAVIDRSLSFYILEKLDQRGGAIRQNAFESVFTEEYMIEHRLVDVRLTEQLKSGTIRIENGCVALTNKGRRVSKFGRYFRTNWLPKKRLLMGEYSDDLTDPFRNSGPTPDYTCLINR